MMFKVAMATGSESVLTQEFRRLRIPLHLRENHQIRYIAKVSQNHSPISQRLADAAILNFGTLPGIHRARVGRGVIDTLDALVSTCETWGFKFQASPGAGKTFTHCISSRNQSHMGPLRVCLSTTGKTLKINSRGVRTADGSFLAWTRRRVLGRNGPGHSAIYFPREVQIMQLTKEIIAAKEGHRSG
jgi:hypothetical protein